MKEQDFKIDLGAVEETLVLPLWARAKDAEKKDPIVNDTYALDIVAKIDYDFAKIETKYLENHQLVWSIRAYNFDNCVRGFLKDKSNPMVINIGAGLDTTFKRVDQHRTAGCRCFAAEADPGFRARDNNTQVRV